MNPPSSSIFFWADNSWYYVYAWANGLWDAGRWLRGRDLCDFVSSRTWGEAGPSVIATWYAIWSNTQQRMALFDNINFAAPAVCLHVAEFAPPGTVIA